MQLAPPAEQWWSRTVAEIRFPRAAGLVFATLLALGATLFGAMLSVANERALNPDNLTWLDAPPLEEVLEAKAQAEAPEEVDTRPVLDTGRHRNIQLSKP